MNHPLPTEATARFRLPFPNLVFGTFCLIAIAGVLWFWPYVENQTSELELEATKLGYMPHSAEDLDMTYTYMSIVSIAIGGALIFAVAAISGYASKKTNTIGLCRYCVGAAVATVPFAVGGWSIWGLMRIVADFS